MQNAKLGTSNDFYAENSFRNRVIKNLELGPLYL